MNRNLTLEQRMWNAYSSVECERLHGIHQMLVMACQQPEEFAVFWDRSDESAWGFSWGWLIGLKEILHAQFINLEIKNLLCDIEMPQNYPEASGIEAGIIGFTEYNELNSGVVEVAEDGKSCRASYICHGMCYTHYNEDFKRWGCFTNERYGADFVFDEETSHWKFLHELVAPDGGHTDDFDTGNIAYDGYAQLSELVPVGADVPLGQVRQDINARPEGDVVEYDPDSAPPPPPRSYRKTLHYGYSPVQGVQATIQPPSPYKTFGGEDSYLPKDAKIDNDVFFKDERGNWTYDVNKRYPQVTG